MQKIKTSPASSCRNHPYIFLWRDSAYVAGLQSGMRLSDNSAEHHKIMNSPGRSEGCRRLWHTCLGAGRCCPHQDPNQNQNQNEDSLNDSRRGRFLEAYFDEFLNIKRSCFFLFFFFINGTFEICWSVFFFLRWNTSSLSPWCLSTSHFVYNLIWTTL